MDAHRRAGGYSLALAALLVVVMTVAAGIGPVPLAPATVLAVVANAIVVPVGVSVTGTASLLQAPAIAIDWAPLVSVPVDRTATAIVMSVRLPRIALGATVGFALAAAGVVMQGFFRNPMADPSIIGVSSGAAVGAVLTIVAPFAVPLGLRPAAFLGALVTAAVVYAIATEGGRTPVATLLLAGVAVQTLLGAVTSYLLLRSGESMRRVVYWLMGHLDASTFDEALVTGVLGLLLVGVMYLYAGDLNALLLGEDEAQSVGIEVERTKRILLAAASIVTGAAVAVAGVIGFVGLIVPHAMRLLVGPDHRVLLPTSALAGASFLVAADTLARAGAAALPVGIVTAAVGAPFFLYLLREREVTEL